MTESMSMYQSGDGGFYPSTQRHYHMLIVLYYYTATCFSRMTIFTQKIYNSLRITQLTTDLYQCMQCTVLSPYISCLCFTVQWQEGRQLNVMSSMLSGPGPNKKRWNYTVTCLFVVYLTLSAPETNEHKMQRWLRSNERGRGKGVVPRLEVIFWHLLRGSDEISEKTVKRPSQDLNHTPPKHTSDTLLLTPAISMRISQTVIGMICSTKWDTENTSGPLEW
jgi:hypothetical protein